MLKSWLAHPLTHGLDLDSSETTALRLRIIQEKPFLRRIYLEWYTILTEALNNKVGDSILELGSGGGFLNEMLPGLITSDVIPLSQVDVVLDGHCLPFQTAALGGILMTNVLHHLPQPRAFFNEAARCVQPGGMIAMIEPWMSPWSRLVFGKLHHEPFQPQAQDWSFPQSGPLSGANGALPWIIFHRDRAKFEEEFSTLRIQTIRPCMPFRYLVAGGISMRNLMPNATYPFWRWLENILRPWMRFLAMFASIVLVRVTPPGKSPVERNE
ncbi:MAG: methyltransferase domain-containing protein [Deltaproteobacteria bacterium]|nr:methyltransferase domain-containing protein [Deltaproteobacteria bacterium]MBL7205245.1 methyltransferase domain-containing protein [Desulfobacteraceae bacterium]